MAIKMYSPSQAQWVDYNEELVNESVGTIYVNNRWKIAWKGLHAHNGVRFTRWTSTNSLPSTVGNYVLMNDVTLTSTWTVPNGLTNLCLNGFKINLNGNRTITIGASATLNLFDCNIKQRTNNITSQVSWATGQQTINGGVITGGTNCAITINGGIFNMFGGTIAGNKATIGAGVVVNDGGEAYIYGGRFAYNNATNGGGGIASHGTGTGGKLYFYNGLIDNNYAYYGGGLFCRQNGFLNVSGGEIKENRCGNANNGGGGGICFGASFANRAELYGGLIKNNQSGYHGGGVSINSTAGTVVFKNVDIEYNTSAQDGGGVGFYDVCTLQIEGTPIIKNNKKSSITNNLHIPSKNYSTKFNVIGKLINADVGITMTSAGIFTSDYSTYNTETPDTFFSSDDSNYEVVIASGEAKLQAV